jgi:orotate phosphoribosyltransferase
MDSTIQQIFESTGALLQGHFLLTSGLHSDKYLQCARVLQWPQHAEAFGRELASSIAEKADFVISPAIGGIIIGQEVARFLGCRAIFAERENGNLRLRRGFSIDPGEKGVVVEDVITTGGSTSDTIQVVRHHGGTILCARSIVDRSGGKTLLDVPYRSLWTLSVPSYAAIECPQCLSGSRPVKPGSRNLA